MSSEIVAGYERPFPRLRSLLCLAQRSFPLLAAVVPGPLVYKDGVGNFEGAMRRTMEAGGVAGTIKLFCSGFADWAKEGPGHLSTLRPISDTRKKLASNAMTGRVNCSRINSRARMRRQGVEDIKGKTPLALYQPPKQPRRKLSKAELR